MFFFSLFSAPVYEEDDDDVQQAYLPEYYSGNTGKVKCRILKMSFVKEISRHEFVFILMTTNALQAPLLVPRVTATKWITFEISTVFQVSEFF